MLRRKEENQDQFHIEKKLKIKRKEVNYLNKKLKSSLQGIPSNFDGTCNANTLSFSFNTLLNYCWFIYYALVFNFLTTFVFRCICLFLN